MLHCALIVRERSRGEVTGRYDQDCVSLHTHISCTQRRQVMMAELVTGIKLASMLNDFLVWLDDIQVHQTWVLFCNGHQAMGANIVSLRTQES